MTHRCRLGRPAKDREVPRLGNDVIMPPIGMLLGDMDFSQLSIDLREKIGARERREIQDVIEDFRSELVPLVVPMTLIRHHVRAHGIDYLAGQTYLEPHPKELMLRNHV